MLNAFRQNGHGLIRLDAAMSLDDALWIDLLNPTEAEVAEVARFGLTVPTLAEMEEIEISNRLYREEGADYLTVVLPGHSGTDTAVSGPVTFILMPGRLVTVRHHSPRPFETYPARADKATAGSGSPERVFLGLMEEIVARQADILEGIGHALDRVTHEVFDGRAGQNPEVLQLALEQTGRQGDLLGRVRLGLLTLERALSFFGQTLAARHEGDTLGAVVKGQMRDMQALEVHADFLSSRVSLAVDATLGMVNLAQNVTVRIVSVVAVLFLPPTLIASIYGMNFAHMPELATAWGYPVALLLMVASALGTYFFFKWRHWL
jgi:magnesium transporter